MKYISALNFAFCKASILLTGLSLLLLSSCNEDPTFLGRELLPPTDEFGSFYYEGEPVISFSVLADSTNTSLNSLLLLGSYSDDVFGKNICEVGLRPEIIAKAINGSITVDSMVLSLNFNKVFSDSVADDQRIRVYVFKDSTRINQPFYSNYDFEGKYDPQELGNVVVTPNLDTSFTVSMHLESESLVDKFENLPDSVFTDINDFVSNFNAFYLTTDEMTENESVLFLDYNSNFTNFKVYYTEIVNDTATNDFFYMNLGRLTPPINSFKYDPSGTRAGLSLSETFQTDSLMFLSSMGGMRTKLNFPEIEEWMNPDSSAISINSAKLILPVNHSSISDLSKKPEKLILLSYRDEIPDTSIALGLGPYEQIFDDLVDQDGTYFGGDYNEDEDAYIFNIGLHFQHFVNKENANMDMILLPTSSSQSGSRVILNSPLHPDNPMKLKIIYTKF